MIPRAPSCLIIPGSLATLPLFHFFLLFPQTHSGRDLGAHYRAIMGGPEGEFPAPWFANRGLVPLSVPCNRGSGLWSLPSPPVRGRTKCTDCTLCVLVKARLPSLWRLGTGKEDRGPRCGWEKRLKTPHLWLFCRTLSVGIWDCGRDVIKNHLKSPKKFHSLVGARPWRCKGGPQGGKRKGGLWIPL